MEMESDLLESFAMPCVLMEKKRVPGPEGGWVTAWTDGAEFLNYQALDNSMEARIAEKEGVTSLYTAMVDKEFPIEYGDYYRDTKSGITYRVTSKPEESAAPGISDIPLKSFSAERKEIPK